MPLPPENLIDIADSLRQATSDGPIWSVNSEQLNANLLRLPAGDAIAEHVNGEVDVVLAVFEGRGELAVDGAAYPLGPGCVVVIPRGARRAVQRTAGPLVYLTCHRRRAISACGGWPYARPLRICACSSACARAPARRGAGRAAPAGRRRAHPALGGCYAP
jgi:mannose-6-phosphate isomerase-like protein (cupin superfamily)